MNKRCFFVNVVLLFCFLQMPYSVAQFAPPAGQVGSTALHKDSVQWACWASLCSPQLGYLNIGDTTLGLVSSGSAGDACSLAAEGAVLSLGDGGSAVLQFPYPVRNDVGPDFAVFENAFSDSFLELAFVEVSSDGLHFVRFPAYSNSDTLVQIGSFGAVDATKIHNLAGKYRFGYGTPFDLEDLADSSGIDLQRITHIRIVDVVGSLDNEFARRDCRGYKINDPWPTPFNVGGFDLDAVGVIHAQYQSALQNLPTMPTLQVFPNPVANGAFQLRFEDKGKDFCQIFNLQGQLFFEGNVQSGDMIDAGAWPAGTYVLKLGSSTSTVLISKI